MGQTLLILSDAFTPGFSGVSVAQSLAFCVVGLLRSLLSLSFCFLCHCIVCPFTFTSLSLALI